MIDQKPIDTQAGYSTPGLQNKNQNNIIPIEDWAQEDRRATVATVMTRILGKPPKKAGLLEVLFEAREMKIGDVVAAIELAHAKVINTKHAPRCAKWFVSVVRTHREHQRRYSEPPSVSGLGFMNSAEVDYLASAFDSTSDDCQPSRMGVTGERSRSAYVPAQAC